MKIKVKPLFIYWVIGIFFCIGIYFTYLLTGYRRMTDVAPYTIKEIIATIFYDPLTFFLRIIIGGAVAGYAIFLFKNEWK